MKLKNLILPFLLVTIFVIQCFSSPLGRYRWMYSGQINDDDDDTEGEEEYYDERLHIPAKELATWTADSLTSYADSVLLLDPVDSIMIERTLILSQVPDSLQHLADSLSRKAYIKDSTHLAKLAFQAWFDTLPKKAQKKWIIENVKIPMQRHRMDSILARKDSLQAIKDSIIENTPRILETPFIPDSLWYKRIVMFSQEKHFGEFRKENLDTSFNYHFYEYPFFHQDVNATWLGIAGSPTQLHNASKREEEENAIFFTPHRAWTYDASSLPTYNTKTPHTELAYWGTPFGQNDEEEMNVRFMTTQNITPKLNATFELNKFGAGGQLQKQVTNAYHLAAALNYLGKKYSAHGGWIHDHTTANENGGVVNLSDIRDTTLRSRELEVNLSKAESDVKREVLFLNHNLRIPFGKDSLTTAFIGHTTEWSLYKRNYSDNITDSYGRAFYNDIFLLNPSKSNDKMEVMKLDNRIYLKMQPWKEDFVISRINVGIGDKLLSYKDRVQTEVEERDRYSTIWQNNLYAYAGINGKVKKYFAWDATARFTFLGYEAGDFDVNAGAVASFYPFRKDRNSPVSLSARFRTRLTSADHYQQKLLMNHYSWDNNFGKTSHTQVTGRIDIPHWKLDAEVSYNLMANKVYYDTLGIARQSDKAVSVITADLHKEFVLWKFHLDNRVLLQFSSDNKVMPVPLVSLNLRYYLEFPLVKNVLQAQLGVNAFFNTKWYLPAYNPEIGVFYNQRAIELGNTPVFDVFVNLQWKRACIFIKMENVGNGGPLKKNKDYFTALGYIHTQRGFKAGIFWPFYVRPGKVHNHSHDNGHDHDSGFGSGMGGGMKRTANKGGGLQR